MGELTGKRLGRAVLAEVMGWTEYGVGNDYPLFDAQRQKGAIFVLASPELRWRQWAGWQNKNDAWEVVELFRRGWNGHAAAFVQITIYDSATISDTCVFISAPDIPEVEAWSNDVCEAILQAALKIARVVENEQPS